MGCLNTTYKYQLSHSPFKLYQLQLQFLDNWKKLSMKHTARCIIIKICNKRNSSSNPYPISVHPIRALSTLCRVHRHFPLKEKKTLNMLHATGCHTKYLFSHRDLWSCPTSLVHAYLWIFHWCLFLQSSTERTMVSTKNRTPMGTATPTPTSICVSVLPVLRVLRTTARVRVNQGQITHYCAVCMWQSQSKSGDGETGVIGSTYWYD